MSRCVCEQLLSEASPDTVASHAWLELAGYIVY